MTAFLLARRRRNFERGKKKTEKEGQRELKAVTIYEIQHCRLMYAHKFRLPSDFTDLFYSGN